ncbi:hypothetical protein C8F01DRAFT_1251120 [Mycena amicta]|nr:hypothetical protein C8F01DRAFT_1251120 [Mycena amicta]
MIGTRAILLLFAVFLFAYMVIAAPIPADAGLVKKTLKQFVAKRGETPSRVGRAAAVPSGYNARGVTKRDDAALPKPSKGYRR